MFCKTFILFYLVGILCIYVAAGSSHARKCSVKDRQALLKLKDGFIDEWDILSSWKGEDCCKWRGISCNNLTGRVTKLDLQSLDYSSLEGMIDSSICELQHLTSLNVVFNDLKGKIPECIGTLGQLKELRLSFNFFGGDIPHTLGNLSKLQILDIGYNYYLVANNLEWVSHLSNLRYLDLSVINLRRAFDWLSSISQIPSLSNIYLDDCGLHQVNPKFIAHMNFSNSLKILSLSGNNLSSSIPLWVLNVSKVLTHLDLSYNYFQQSIPDGFANLISLQYLDLSNNELEGSIPKSFQNFCQLKGLKLQSNKLSGQLSDSIQQLCNAQTLDLSHNPFKSGSLPLFTKLSSLNTLSLRNTNVVGPLPQSFGHLPNLANLDLSFNQLSGSLPSFDVSKLASLENVDLSHNQLNGTLPYAIGQFSSLKRFSLSYNKLNGVISEAHLSNLSRLQILNVAQNSLTFNFSSNWVSPFQLIGLYASSCILGPKFPTWLKHQGELENLQISNCGILGTFPKWFWDLTSQLSYLNVSHNKLSGPLPKSFPSMRTSTNIWDFSFNRLSGPLPHFPELYALFVSNNMFSGSISSFCATSPLDLSFLDLSGNMLVGPLSDCWEKFKYLQVLNLANNNLSGEVRESFGTLQQIQTLHLNNNNFSGEIPYLTNCRNLTFIDLGNNNLQGMLPAWVGHNLHRLIVLRLRGNKLQGNIPTSLCKLLSLQVLDLSNNNITGEIPQCLSHINALSKMKFPRLNFFYDAVVPISSVEDTDMNMFTDKAILVWKGGNREYGKILGLLTIIDLSYNHLTGEIPQSITTLVALASLNLSGNNLTGFIPKTIGHMQMLESLDLSKNHLYGNMPSSFSKLSFLSYMNLSFNNLSGKIPISTQLQSFNPSTYMGNNGLCGPPLTNPCPGDAISPNGSTHKNDSNEGEDELITFGFYITLGIGFFVGFWGVCGTLVIKSSWRYAYFQFFNNINDWIYVTLVVFIARMKRRFQIQDQQWMVFMGI